MTDISTPLLGHLSHLSHLQDGPIKNKITTTTKQQQQQNLIKPHEQQGLRVSTLSPAWIAINAAAEFKVSHLKSYLQSHSGEKTWLTENGKVS